MVQEELERILSQGPAARIVGVAAAAPNYMRGETTTCHVTVKNNSGFPITCYAQVYLGYVSWGIWYDSSTRVWVRFDLDTDEQKTLTAHPVVLADAPYGERRGQVDLFEEETRASTMLDSNALLAAAYIVGVAAASIISQEWVK